MPRFVEELNKRNVLRLGAVYIVGGWLGIQAAQLVAPPWAVKVLIVLLIVGFPVALLLAWFFELTPKGVRLHMSVLPEESIAPQVGRVLNKLVIGLAALAVLHFLWLVKADLREPLVYAAIVAGLLVARLALRARRTP